ncbi:Rieske 2Fe-2S domain-containing protein [Plantactinospora sp. S1510]|uniref:Cytochrome bc1 complex Rieske iron-sulfur subunit n=1 Tax=Plantactinospora alkalitolerans TaxID=2789879 RepID=A0ABS0H972_9ACTN|nr:Rieske (2Fe-2S) protein [Plantactinospora alkalitolerans]MBF9134637.1 Rieske 2Fe-2S domain-containing protein [Plantactinospora alkalitolerans]
MSDDQAVTGPGTQTRRTLLAGAGAVGASVVLAACGTGDDDALDGGAAGTPSAGGAPATGGSASAPAANGGGNALAKKSEIPVGGGKIIQDQQIVVTQPTEGEFKAFSSICTHQKCPVTSVDGGTINCSCHGSKFAVADGSVKTGPASKKLEEKKVKVDGDNIVLA